MIGEAAVRHTTVEVRRDDYGLAGLGDEWDELFSRCATATPFQSYAWLQSWWRSYGRPGRLRLVLVRLDGRLIGAAALTLVRRGGCAVLTPLGGALSDFTDVLVDDEAGAEAARLLAGAIAREPGWQALDLPETRPGSVAGGALLDAWPGGRWTLPASLCLELPARPMDDLLAELPKKTRGRVRYKLNLLKRADVEIREVTADEATRAVPELLRLHALQWQGRGVNTHHLSRTFAEHLTRAVRDMIASDQAALIEYRFGGRLMASSLLLIGPDLTGAYLYGLDPELRQDHDVTVMMLSDAMPLAHRRGCSTMSMLRGAEEYKLRWRPRESVNQRILLARPGSARGLAYASGVRAYRGSVQAAKQYAPWLRTARDRARQLLSRHR